MRELLRNPKIRHPLHFIAGFISGACLFHPEVAIGIASSVLTFVGFYRYEKWEEEDIGDQGWKDWWEFITPYFVMAAIVLIRGLVI